MRSYVLRLVISTLIASLPFACFGQALPGSYSQHIPSTDQRIPMVGVIGGVVVVSSYIPRERNPSAEAHMQVDVDSFWIGKYEIRYLEFDAWRQEMAEPVDVMASRLSKLNGRNGISHALLDTRSDRGQRPATGMNHWSAKRFCHWLSIRTGHFYRLPTEAEWEYACRGGGPLTSSFPWGDQIRELTDFAVIGSGTQDGLCHIVGQRKPNGFGIYDMIGNVEEWVADGFDEKRIGNTASSNPVVWPLSTHPFPIDDSITEEFKQQQQRFVDAYGVTKGGSGLVGRPLEWRAFSVSARSNPVAYDRSHVIASPAGEPSSMSESLGPAMGFRVARPVTIPDRQIQLWHWGIYTDQADWLDTTLEPDRH